MVSTPYWSHSGSDYGITGPNRGNENLQSGTTGSTTIMDNGVGTSSDSTEFNQGNQHGAVYVPSPAVLSVMQDDVNSDRYMLNHHAQHQYLGTPMMQSYPLVPPPMNMLHNERRPSLTLPNSFASRQQMASVCAAIPTTKFKPQQEPKSSDSCETMNNDHCDDISQRKRTSKACDHCRQRKIKCGPLDPVSSKCNNCVRFACECTFDERENNRTRRSGKRGYPNDSSWCFVGFEPNSRTFVSSGKPQPERHYNSIDKSTVNIKEETEHYSSSSDSGKIRSLSKQKYNMKEVSTPNTSSSVNSLKRDVDASEFNSQMSFKRLDTRIEKLDRKMSIILDNLARFEWILSRKTNESRENVERRKELPRAKIKHYTNTLLSLHKLEWVKSRLASNLSTLDFLRPLGEIFSTCIKSYLTNIRRFTDLTLLPIDKDRSLRSIPSRSHLQSILEMSYIHVAFDAYGLMDKEKFEYLIDKFYQQNENAPQKNKAASFEKMIDSELFLLNTYICIGTWTCRLLMHSNSEYFKSSTYGLSEDTLKEYENNSLLNSMRYYYRLSLLPTGPLAIEALILLALYLQKIYFTEFARTVLQTAVRFAIQMGYDKKLDYLPEHEILKRKTIWWHCYRLDSFQSLHTSRAPLIDRENIGTLCDTTFNDWLDLDIKTNIGSPSDKKLTLTLAAPSKLPDTNMNYIPYLIGYYCTNLVELQMQVYSICFTQRNLLSHGFDEVLNQIMTLFEDLEKWVEGLHPFMKCETFQDAWNNFVSTESTIHSRHFEVIRAKVIATHIEYFHLKCTLGIYAVKFLLDNQDLFNSSSHDVHDLLRDFTEKYITSSEKLIDAFLALNYEFRTQSEYMFQCFTACFILCFNVIKYCTKSQLGPVATEQVKLLYKTLKSIVGEGFSNVCDNIMENTSVFTFAFLLRHILSYLSENGILPRDLKYENQFFDSLWLLLKHNSFNTKNILVNRYQTELQEINGNRGSSDIQGISSIGTINFIDFFDINCMLDKNFVIDSKLLEILISSSPITNFDEAGNRIATPVEKLDTSIFPMDPPDYSVVYSIHETDSHEDTFNQKCNHTETSYKECPNGLCWDVTLNDEEFGNSLPFGRLIFDRYLTLGCVYELLDRKYFSHQDSEK